MRWEWEQWRKLYLREPNEQLLWPVLFRGFRNYLLQRANDLGMVFPVTDDPVTDLCQALGAHDWERDIVRKAVGQLLEDGFLVHGTDRSLVVRNLVDAQARRSKEAKRKAAQREKKKREREGGTSPGTSPGTLNGTGTPNVPDKNQGSDLISGDPIRSAAAARAREETKPVDAIRAELLRWPSCRSLPTDAVAEMLATRFATIEISKGTRIEWFLESLGQAASDGVGLNSEALTKQLRKYGDRTRPPRREEHKNGHAAQSAVIESKEPTAEEQAAIRQRAEARVARQKEHRELVEKSSTKGKPTT